MFLAADPFLNDVNFVLSVLTLEELGATGNKGLSGILINPVHANAVAGLATSGDQEFLIVVSCKCFRVRMNVRTCRCLSTSVTNGVPVSLDVNGTSLMSESKWFVLWIYGSKVTSQKCHWVLTSICHVTSHIWRGHAKPLFLSFYSLVAFCQTF